MYTDVATVIKLGRAGLMAISMLRYNHGCMMYYVDMVLPLNLASNFAKWLLAAKSSLLAQKAFFPIEHH